MNWFDNKMKKIGAGIGAMAVLFAVGTLTPGDSKAAAGPTPVLVTNTTVPVSGSVGVSSLPANLGNVVVTSGNVAVTGTVGISGTPNVNVANRIVVQNMDEKGRAPYQQSGFVQCIAANSFCDLTLPAVPPNKRLVVEHVSANIFAPDGLNGTFLIVGGNTLSALPGRGSSSPGLLAVNEAVLMYFEAGASPLYRVVPSTTSGNASFSATITGYLVDLTQ